MRVLVLVQTTVKYKLVRLISLTPLGRWVVKNAATCNIDLGTYESRKAVAVQILLQFVIVVVFIAAVTQGDWHHGRRVRRPLKKAFTMHLQKIFYVSRNAGCVEPHLVCAYRKNAEDNETIPVLMQVL